MGLENPERSYNSKIGGGTSHIGSEKKGGMVVYWGWVAIVSLSFIAAVIK